MTDHHIHDVPLHQAGDRGHGGHGWMMRRMPFELLSEMVPLTLRIREQLMTRTQAARQRRRLRYPESYSNPTLELPTSA